MVQQPIYVYGNYGVYNPFMYMKTMVQQPLYVYGNYGVYNPFMYMETMVYTTRLCKWKLFCIYKTRLVSDNYILCIYILKSTKQILTSIREKWAKIN